MANSMFKQLLDALEEYNECFDKFAAEWAKGARRPHKEDFEVMWDVRRRTFDLAVLLSRKYSAEEGN